ncbi:glycoside hydrolase family 5 protein [Salidesulfovibrio onnuriiensis]|uniref:glycoside hydrolase family 5 protein n=1 Tax=Salidesulfovibrio onnuriiensis TaxID=2583823 RepID=UPI0011CB3243|nr:cellulase family glycosylhydrolase [Salidesulfovibrio onnuriiensis]
MNNKILASAFFLALLLTSLLSFAVHAATPADFWKTQRTGTNCFNKVPEESWFKDAADLGVSWVRLAIDKWEGERDDFLMGDADDYRGLVEADAQELGQVLDWAHKYGLKVVLTPLSLPGARWSQNNGGRFDSRLWENRKYWNQTKAYWRDIAERFGGHPALVAYNIKNEPAPEKGRGVAEHELLGDVSRYQTWYEKHRGTAADLYQFYTEVIAAIRTVDKDMPIMVDGGWYAQPGAFTYWPGALSDPNVLYSFHMYEPYKFTSNANAKRKYPFVYPGVIPFAGKEVDWNRDTLELYMSPLFQWAAKHNIPSYRIVAGEFGCMRRNSGCRQYLEDVLAILDDNQLHWAFYSFREDEWDGYDYEVGTKPLGWKYWEAVERGEHPGVPRKPNPLFAVIRSHLK